MQNNRIKDDANGSRPAVLFVCLGNICRSPLAEGLFRREAEEAGLDVEIDSAGTGDWNVGKAPDPRTQTIARKYGLDISTLRARQVTPEDFHRFSHIYAFDAENLANLQKIRPADSTAELQLLLDLVPGRAGEAVADPYFGDDSGFETSWADISAGVGALVGRMSAATEA